MKIDWRFVNHVCTVINDFRKSHDRKKTLTAYQASWSCSVRMTHGWRCIGIGRWIPECGLGAAVAPPTRVAGFSVFLSSFYQIAHSCLWNFAYIYICIQKHACAPALFVAYMYLTRTLLEQLAANGAYLFVAYNRATYLSDAYNTVLASKEECYHERF